MTEKTQPTDAEIEALGHRMCWRYKHDTGVNHISTFTFNAQTLHDFARAVLAKWGTPAPVEVEPVAWRVARDKDEYELFFNKQLAERRAECFTRRPRVEPLYTVTQTGAGAVPLTDAEARNLVWSIDSAWFRSGSVSEEDALELVRATEHRHGIKGGQHG